jgi:hypothetical protein
MVSKQENGVNQKLELQKSQAMLRSRQHFHDTYINNASGICSARIFIDLLPNELQTKTRSVRRRGV